MYMSYEQIRDAGQTLAAPTRKVLGIVDTRGEFDALIEALKAAGFNKVEALCGEEGVALLERVDNLFFSDLEDRVLSRHIDELKGRAHHRRDSAPRRARERGGSRRLRKWRSPTCAFRQLANHLAHQISWLCRKTKGNQKNCTMGFQPVALSRQIFSTGLEAHRTAFPTKSNHGTPRRRDRCRQTRFAE
jgi:hypothetical protein